MSESPKLNERYINWLRSATVKDLLGYLSIRPLMFNLTSTELLTIAENPEIVTYLAKNVLPSGEDERYRSGKQERPEAIIYATIGTNADINVNAMTDLEGTPVRTRKGEASDKDFKAPEDYELIGILSEYIHDKTGNITLGQVISEILDVTWNLIKLERAGINHGLENYNRQFAELLGLTYDQYLAMVVAKYHGRYFKGGKNITAEQELVQQLFEQFSIQEKVRLNDLSQLAVLLFRKELVAVRSWVEAQYEREKLTKGYGLMAQGLATEAEQTSKEE